ncbi:MAG TPA: sulfotransferase domain-containing protein [Bryobacteraceae bacterium]|nr:sulfotransferase domain-containing protein [Bryobacteraceae bacterium]
MGSAVAPAQATKICLYHLTFYKCGSQWIRDILSDPRITEFTEHSLAATGVDVLASPWPELAVGQFASPVYTSGNKVWTRNARPHDRAFVVIRDPRDIVVSLTYSLSYSHTPGPVTQLLRAPVAEANPSHRLQIGMFLLAQWSDYLASWRPGQQPANVYLAKYEDLISDLSGQLNGLFHFLHWDIPPSVVSAVARDNAFEARSGRKPGQENEFSHRRKGIAGDWQNHFHRELGQLFEESFPGLLVGLGYEEHANWWELLPEALDRPAAPHVLERNRLLSVLEEHERELAIVRTAAEQRLHDVHVLHDMLAESNRRHEMLYGELAAQGEVVSQQQSSLVSLSGQVKHLLHEPQPDEQRWRGLRDVDQRLEALAMQNQMMERSAAERLEQVNYLTNELTTLHGQLRTLQEAADERLQGILRHKQHQQDLESSFAWRFGFRPLRALFSLLRR